MTPFRSMLLTVQSGLHSLAPRAQSVPAYAQVLRHSSITLSRRTRIPWWRPDPLTIRLIFQDVTLMMSHPPRLLPTGRCDMAQAANPTRHNRTLTVDFHNEATYFALCSAGKVFIEFVLAFLLSLGFQLLHTPSCS